ncbi:MAG: tRNA(Ile)-lysidine synthase [Mycoplasmataceae bacterium]|nr:MAG: tRNA(Ile)-lysidine synthase [Mycoplasmataceae bacterium]
MKKGCFTPIKKNKNSLYIIGVSGGPDSMFLLDKMRKLGYNVVAAHVNYEKRLDSYVDEKIVFDYCNKFGIQFFLHKPTSYGKGNFQNIAREIRYNFFFDIADKLSNNVDLSVDGIVIAHNFEDLLETYKLQIKRKSFVNYWGLPFKVFKYKYWIFRPILKFTKFEILNYLNKAMIDYAIDESNKTSIYQRNIIRKEIFSLSKSEKINISKEIDEKNKDLNFLIKKFKRISEMLINFNYISLNKIWIESDFEIQQRLIYFWINNFSKEVFVQRKKNIIFEIVKQLNSQKKKIVIEIGKGFKIEKNNNLAFIE